MSLILLGLNTLDDNNNGIPICSLPIRTENCGGDFACHYKPNEKSILNMFGIPDEHPLHNSFTLPKKHFCSEHVFYTLWKLRQEEGDAQSNISDFVRPEPKKPSSKTEKLSKQHSVEDVIENLQKQNSISNMYSWLESESFRAYYVGYRVESDEDGEEKGFSTLSCYTTEEEQLLPNNSVKVIIEVLYLLDGTSQVTNWVVSKDEDFTYRTMLGFDTKQEE